jgi:hypothetical protein
MPKGSLRQRLGVNLVFAEEGRRQIEYTTVRMIDGSSNCERVDAAGMMRFKLMFIAQRCYSMRSGILWTMILLAAGSAWAADPSMERKRLDFFETKIRPVLVEHCYECHAADSRKLRGGLLVDSRQGLLEGGESGPAVVPGDLEESLLISALKHDGFEMPPQGKLSSEVVADFEKWIQDGAIDPRRDTNPVARPKAIDIESGRKHWAYHPLKAPTIPTTRNTAWPHNDIDRFILARLEAARLQPAPDAKTIVLVRRLYFDLIGLPPAPEQIVQFVNDKSSGAYENLVDRLMKSPRFGERWGRHWLDVSRFAESMSLRGVLLKHAWRYRDYVIDAFNDDLPFDQFITQQLAGDLLEASSVEVRRQNLIATTFLMMGDTLLENQNKSQLDMDFVDEQLDVIGRGLLAQTITCARCHDHKFDPIPTRDYYAMAGILKNVQGLKHSNVSGFMEVPLPISDAAKRESELRNLSVTRLQREINTLKATLEPQSPTTFPIVVAASSFPGIVVDDDDVKTVGAWTHSVHSKHYIGKRYIHDANKGKGAKTLSFIPKLPGDGEYEVRFAYSHGGGRATNVPVTVFSAAGKQTIIVDMSKAPPLAGRFLSLGTYRFEADEQSLVLISNEGTNGVLTADAVQFLRVDEDSTVTTSPASQAEKELSAGERQALKKSMAKLTADLAALGKQKPAREMVNSAVEKKKPTDLKIHIRGSIDNLGVIAPRGVLQVANYGPVPEMPASSSGRLELANWIVDAKNPLTSRVMVNRVWHWLFGAGLVRTVDNFGTTGESPSHPELLDHLALQFVQQGWSVKKLIRTIVLSRTYRLSAASGEQQEDPENRLLTHMNRRRLDAESLRDAMLSVGGTLEFEMGGATFPANLKTDVGFQFQTPRRSVYVPVFRCSLPELFEVFDFANPSMVTGRRDVSTVAPQALYMMNHTFVRTQGRLTAERLLSESELTTANRIDHAYLLILGRHATEAEVSLSQQFLKSITDTTKKRQGDAWTQMVQAMFSTIEFRYIR